MSSNWRTRARKAAPKPVVFLYRFLRDWRDIAALAGFLADRRFELPLGRRLWLIRRIYQISLNVQCPHTQAEVLAYMREILALPADRPGAVVEAGCFKGGSTAKFSLAAEIAGRELLVFDSFEGIPSNAEDHGTDIFGNPAGFARGSFRGGLEEVQHSVETWGAPGVCRYVKGWFDDTMPSFEEPVASAYIDVDLVSSTQTCLRYLVPRLSSGGAIYSQDGHLPKVLEVFDDDAFWSETVGISKPEVHGFGTSKLIHFRLS